MNGPAVAGRDRLVAAAWYTRAQDQPRVLVSFSRDAGGSFAAPVRVDEGEPLGRVDVTLLDGCALVVWMEGLEKRARIVARLVGPDGRLGAVVRVAETSSLRASGFPRVERVAEGALVAWTETDGRATRVRTAMVRVVAAAR